MGVMVTARFRFYAGLNAESAGLDRMLRDGDGVAVYPPFMHIDGFTRLLPLPAELKFVAEVHLGGLAHAAHGRLRYLFSGPSCDEQIAALSVDEARIVLTRERELLKRSEIARGCHVHALKSEVQMKEIADRLGLAERAAPFTRSLRCNALLHDIAKEEVEDRLPPSASLINRS